MEFFLFKAALEVNLWVRYVESQQMSGNMYIYIDICLIKNSNTATRLKRT